MTASVREAYLARLKAIVPAGINWDDPRMERWVYRQHKESNADEEIRAMVEYIRTSPDEVSEEFTEELIQDCAGDFANSLLGYTIAGLLSSLMERHLRFFQKIMEEFPEVRKKWGSTLRLYEHVALPPEDFVYTPPRKTHLTVVK